MKIRIDTKKYYKMLSELADETYNELDKANEELKEATANLNQYHADYPLNHEYMAKKHGAVDRYHKAQNAAATATRKANDSLNHANRIKMQLEQEYNNRVGVDPNEYDEKLVKLLESGIMTVPEMVHYLNSNSENETMTRVILKYAEPVYRSLNDKDRTQAERLAVAINQAKERLEDNPIESFGVAEDIYRRSLKNPSPLMRDYFHEHIENCLNDSDSSDSSDSNEEA